MNYTEKQIKLAGVIQPEGGPRDFDDALDLQGEGVRILESPPFFEENTGDCCDDLSECEFEKGSLQQEIVDLESEVEDLEGSLGDAVGKIGTQDQVLADFEGTDFAWTAYISGNTADAYPPGHPDYGKNWSSSFKWTANIIENGGALSLSPRDVVVKGPLSGAPTESETNGRATSSRLRPAVDGVPQTVYLTITPYFQNTFYDKFYGTPGTVVWDYDGS